MNTPPTFTEPHPLFLFIASTPLRLKKAKVLLENGADPNVADKCGWTVVHQCAQNGDLPLLQLVVRKGGNVKLCNHQNQLPVDLAAIRRHAPIVRYLELQSCDLRSVCRVSIRDAMGKRTYNRVSDLPLPSMLKLFVNHGSPYQGCEVTVIPPTTWTQEELQEGLVEACELQEFIRSNASAEFLQEHSEVINGTSTKDLIAVFQTMYLWEAFRAVGYEEPLARAPRYSLERIVREEEEEDQPSRDRWNLKGVLEKLKAISPY